MGSGKDNPLMRALLLLLCLALAHAASARDFRLCVDGNDWAPYTFPDHDGTLQQLIRKAAAEQGDHVTFVALPWLRCKTMVTSGEMDGLVAVAFSAETQQRFVFPLAGGKDDLGRALGAAKVMLLRRVGGSVVWNGKRLSGADGPVLYPHGYDGIAALLDGLGLPNDGNYKSDDQMVKAMLAGRAPVIATFAESARTLAERYAGKVEVMAPPLGGVAFYAAFAKTVYAENPAMIESLWRSAAELRSRSVDSEREAALGLLGTKKEQ